MSKITIIEGNSNDKDNIRILMVKGEKGDQGPIGNNQLEIGTVVSGENASAEIIGDSPNQTLNLVLPKGDPGPKGDKGDKGDTGSTPTLLSAFPINSLYFTADDNNPSTFLGGTWQRVAEGLFLVGVGTGTDKNNVQKTFVAGANDGEYKHTQTVNELAEHNHTITDNGHTHNYALSDSGGEYPQKIGAMTPVSSTNRGTTDSHTTGITINNSGSSNAMNVTPPSFGLYVWKRTA